MSIAEQFLQASQDVNTLDQKPTNDVLLKLYALYKQGTEGDITAEAPQNPFDFVAKAKHHARLEVSGMDKETAMQQYIELVTMLKQ